MVAALAAATLAFCGHWEFLGFKRGAQTGTNGAAMAYPPWEPIAPAVGCRSRYLVSFVPVPRRCLKPAVSGGRLVAVEAQRTVDCPDHRPTVFDPRLTAFLHNRAMEDSGMRVRPALRCWSRWVPRSWRQAAAWRSLAEEPHCHLRRGRTRQVRPRRSPCRTIQVPLDGELGRQGRSHAHHQRAGRLDADGQLTSTCASPRPCRASATCCRISSLAPALAPPSGCAPTASASLCRWWSCAAAAGEAVRILCRRRPRRRPRPEGVDRSAHQGRSTRSVLAVGYHPRLMATRSAKTASGRPLRRPATIPRSIPSPTRRNSWSRWWERLASFTLVKFRDRLSPAT